jgi:hypothetical protein
MIGTLDCQLGGQILEFRTNVTIGAGGKWKEFTTKLSASGFILRVFGGTNCLEPFGRVVEEG